VEIKWDEDARKDFVTGFRKRKQQRRKQAEKEQAEKERQARIQRRKELRQIEAASGGASDLLARQAKHQQAPGNEGVDEEQVVEDHFGHLLNSEDGLGKRKRQTPEDADEGDFGQDERAQEHEEEEDEEEGKLISTCDIRSTKTQKRQVHTKKYMKVPRQTQ